MAAPGGLLDFYLFCFDECQGLSLQTLGLGARWSRFPSASPLAWWSAHKNLSSVSLRMTNSCFRVKATWIHSLCFCLYFTIWLTSFSECFCLGFWTGYLLLSPQCLHEGMTGVLFRCLGICVESWFSSLLEYTNTVDTWMLSAGSNDHYHLHLSSPDYLLIRSRSVWHAQRRRGWRSLDPRLRCQPLLISPVLVIPTSTQAGCDLELDLV